MKEFWLKSKSLVIIILLSIAGGFIDGYSYLLRDGSLATMQTGNMIYLIVKILDGNYSIYVNLVPILAFCLGILLAVILKSGLKIKDSINKIIIVIVEIALIICAGFVPLSNLNVLSTSLLSICASLQLVAFNDLDSMQIPTTMCTGNLKNASEHLGLFITHRKRDNLYKFLKYFAVIISFIFGVFISYYAIILMDVYSVWSLIFIYLLVLLLIVRNN